MKFARRSFLKKCLEAFGKESVKTMRSYNLADNVDHDKDEKKDSTLEIKQEELSLARSRPKKV